MKHTMYSEKIVERLSPDFGVGIEFMSTGYKDESYGPAITARCDHNFNDEGLRVCAMEVTSWIGVSIGANHYYVRLSFHGCSFTNPDGTEHPRAYTWPNGMPEEAESVEIEVRRPVTQRDIDYAKKRRDGYIPRPGDTERGFWTEAEAHTAGIACFNEKFAPGWVLMSHNDKGNLVEIARS